MARSSRQGPCRLETTASFASTCETARARRAAAPCSCRCRCASASASLIAACHPGSQYRTTRISGTPPLRAVSRRGRRVAAACALASFSQMRSVDIVRREASLYRKGHTVSQTSPGHGRCRQSAIDRAHASNSLVRGKGSRTRVSLDDTGYSKARVLMIPASRSPKGAPVHLLFQAGKALLVATRLVLQAHIRSVSRVGLAPLLLELAAERGLGGGAGNHV